MAEALKIEKQPNQPLQLTLRQALRGSGQASGQASGNCGFINVFWFAAGFGLSKRFGKPPPCLNLGR